MPRPNLLFLSQTLPYPPDSGVKVRTFHTLRLLSQWFEVDALCFFRRHQTGNGASVEESVEALTAYARISAFAIPQEWSRSRFVWDHVRSLVSRRAYTKYVYEERSFRAELARRLEARVYDAVHVESLDLSAFLPVLARMEKPLVCVHHNVESLLLRRRAKRAAHPLSRFYVGHQARLTELEERFWSERVSLNIMVSDEDAATLKRIQPKAATVTAPNGVDVKYFQPSRLGDASSVAFLGGTEWFPNRDGLEYFGEAILPILRASRPDLRVRAIGRASPSDIRHFEEQYGIELTGYVEDVRPFLAEAACLIVPLRVGGGSRLKILDSWAMGKAVVSTSVGCEGLTARDGENILIRDSEPAFASGILDVLNDRDLRDRVGMAARRTAEQEYSWEAIGKVLGQAYEGLLSQDLLDEDQRSG